MNQYTRTFEALPAVRAHVPLFVGIMGCSGSGKSFSALRLATGIQRVSGGDIFAIDTESKRLLHYADQFKFKHIDFGEPFGSLDYLEAIRYCVKQGAGVVVVDSMSHEHTGNGGYLQTQEAEVDRMAGEDYAKRERVKMAGWIKPSRLRQQMISGLLQLNCNVIFAFRAKEKTKPAPGKQPIEMGFMPIAGEELLFEMTVNCLLMPKADGVPTWRSDQIGERLMMKLPGQFEHMFPEGKPLDEDTGAALAEWARGSSVTRDYASEASESAAKGVDEFRKFWKGLSKPARDTLTLRMSEFQKIAKDADAANDDPFATEATTNSGDAEQPSSDNEGAEAMAPLASAPSDPNVDLLVTGAARASAGMAALTDFLDALTKEESDAIPPATRKAWKAIAFKASAREPVA
jgi:ABC-type oligopeptide transport system ATPase subunit